MGIDAIATVLGIVAVVIALAELGRRSTIPYPTMMVVAGLIIACIPGLPPLSLSPEIVFLVFLPPVLYSAAWNTSWHDFRRAIRPISLLAIGLVLATTAVVAGAAHALIPGMTWAAAFVLGAIVSPPDAAAATAICERLRVPGRIVTIIEGESLVNDASGLIAYRVALAAVVTGAFSFWSALGQLVAAAVGGVAIGLAAGAAISAIHHRFRDPMVATAMSLLAPYAAYLPAELLHASGVLATVTAGLVVSRQSPRTMSPGVRLEAVPVWQVLVLLLNGVIFVLIGLQLRQVLFSIAGYSIPQIVWYGAAISIVVILVRILWVFPNAYLPFLVFPGARKLEPRPPRSHVAIVAWTGMRGIVSLAAAMAIPFVTGDNLPFPHRDLIVIITFGVILSTLVLQSITLPSLIRWLGVDGGDEEERQERAARRAAAEAGMARLDALERAGTIDPAAAMRAWEEYAARSREMGLADGDDGAQPAATIAATLQDGAASEARLLLGSDLLDAERAAIVKLRDRGEINDAVFRKLERLMDLTQAQIAGERGHAPPDPRPEAGR